MKKIFFGSILSIGLFISNNSHACITSSWVDDKPLLSTFFIFLYPYLSLLSMAAFVAFLGFVIFLPIAFFSKIEKRKNRAKKISKISAILLVVILAVLFVGDIPHPDNSCGDIINPIIINNQF